MKILLILLIIITSFQIAASAEVYVTYDKSTKEVVDISVRQDVVLKETFARDVLPGTLDQYPLQNDPKYYKYDKNKFILNTQKINADIATASKVDAKIAELAIIEKRQKLIAFQSLVDEGVEFKEVKEADFK